MQARGELPRERSSRSYASIVRANTLTIPNGILFVFGVLTITFGSWKDALFVGILVANIAIGSFQEIRSKRALDRLAALVAPDAVVVRDGAERRIPVDRLVTGDLVRLAAGDQVVADGTLVSADGLALDEANLTGESEPATRAPGEPVWSGSFAVEGGALFEVTAVGPESRAARLTATARAFRHPRSPLERANDRLLLWLLALSLPLIAGITVSVLTRVDTPGARVQALTAASVNLVPEGLILLISLTAAVSAFKVAQRGVLAQQLNAVESLASVDVVCTDKTGTLTEPTVRLVGLVPADGVDEATLARALATYAASSPSRNTTLQAIADAEPAGGDERRVVAQVPFSSRRRWSALDLGDERLVLGAPERFAGVDPALVERARQEASGGRRVLALGSSEAPLPAAGPEAVFPDDVRALGLVVLAERLRPNAAETVAFFAAEDIELKMLSGDAPATAGAIARDAGVPGSAPALDGDALPSQPAALREAVLAAPAVGRISPEGKRAVVEALAAAGRYVAMVGDGVNDVPALKQARLAIAQGSGTQMARSVADLVLVRDDFGVVPGMVAEGRQILRNIQRVAQLFVTKSVFVAVVGLAVAIPTATFPLLPRQFTLASTVTIGIPAFVLALAPSSGPWRPERFHEPPTPPPRHDLIPVTPDVTLFPLARWARTAHQVASRAPAAALDYGESRGERVLREALADHLGRTRGVIAEPEQIVVVQGTAQGIEVVLRLLGSRRVAVEDPSHTTQHERIRAHGLALVAQPVDAEGLVVDGLDADAVLVTPAHQFPTGSVLSGRRRRELLAWAQTRGAMIVEDDYDAEFRYDREPVRALQGVAPEHVIQLGTVSKTLAPALRLGWVVVPPDHADDAERAKRLLDDFSPVLDQLTLAEFLRRGEYDRHVRRARVVYRRRRDRLLARLAEALPELPVDGVAAGVHFVLRLPPGVDDAAVSADARAAGIRVPPLSAYRIVPVDEGGLVVGYGRLHEEAVDPAVRALARVVRRHL